mmetsp:Transcript_57878/g.167739  ORF Transcript_57878/g.167739 Transcript_57878/m.167739 type:complete len:205 (-) Transcript_57878:760-1374(-)
MVDHAIGCVGRSDPRAHLRCAECTVHRARCGRPPDVRGEPLWTRTLPRLSSGRDCLRRLQAAGACKTWYCTEAGGHKPRPNRSRADRMLLACDAFMERAAPRSTAADPARRQSESTLSPALGAPPRRVEGLAQLPALWMPGLESQLLDALAACSVLGLVPLGDERAEQVADSWRRWSDDHGVDDEDVAVLVLDALQVGDDFFSL